MRFTGQIRVPEIDHPGVPATFVVDDNQAEVLLEGESLGRWSLYDVHVSRLVSSAFQVELGGEEITFLADEPVDFAYKGVEHMAEVWARYKSMTMPRRVVAVKRSRKGATPSRIQEFRDAMIENLKVETGQIARPVEEPVMETQSRVAALIDDAGPAETAVHVEDPAEDEPPFEARETVEAESLVVEEMPAPEVVSEPPGKHLGESTDPEELTDREAEEAERLEADRLAAEEARIAEERRALSEERARLEQQRAELDRALEEAERLERERLQAAQLDIQKIEEEKRALQERHERERSESERLEAERKELERLEQERVERERNEAERLELMRLELEKAEEERAKAAESERERLEAERKELERLEADRQQREAEETKRIEAEKKKLERDRAKAEKAKAKAEERRLEKERLERERLEREQAAAEELERERLEREQAAAEELERERLEREAAAEELERERLEREAAAAEAEQDRREKEQAKTERSAADEDLDESDEERVAAISEVEDSKEMLGDLGEFEAGETDEEPVPAGSNGGQQPAVMAGAAAEKSGIMGAVKSAFSRGKNHVHDFTEAPGGIGMVRYICRECGYVSISSSD